MIAYHHAIISHGKALAECLSEHRALSDSKHRHSFAFIENRAGGWNLAPLPQSEPVAGREETPCNPEQNQQ